MLREVMAIYVLIRSSSEEGKLHGEAVEEELLSLQGISQHLEQRPSGNICLVSDFELLKLANTPLSRVVL